MSYRAKQHRGGAPGTGGPAWYRSNLEDLRTSVHIRKRLNW